MKGFLVITMLILLPYGSPAVAHYSTGVDAYNKGDYAAAYREWKPLAKQGVVDAQYNLGWMYSYGKGVKKAYKTAAKWYQLAAEQGHVGLHRYPVHGCLRSEQLYGGTLGIHYGPESFPYWITQSRFTGRQRRTPERGPDHRGTAQTDGLHDGAVWQEPSG